MRSRPSMIRKKSSLMVNSFHFQLYNCFDLKIFSLGGLCGWRGGSGKLNDQNIVPQQSVTHTYIYIHILLISHWR